jgi:Single-strand binding protein family
MEPPFFGWRAGGARPCHVRQDISPDTIRRQTVQNIVEFHIIGRLGRIDAANNVTHISVATNYNRREGERWKPDPRWHRVTLFSKLRDRLEKATDGDLVRIVGRCRQTPFACAKTVSGHKPRRDASKLDGTSCVESTEQPKFRTILWAQGSPSARYFAQSTKGRGDC